VRVAVAEARVPGIRDGVELHVRSLVAQLRRHGHQVETVALPLRAAKETLLTQAAAWRMLDLSSAGGRPIDLLIATRFPTYFARHPRKVLWLFHQHRAADDPHGTPFTDFTADAADTALRARFIELDTRMLSECSRIFTNARNTADRLRRFNGIEGAPLYHPPPTADMLREGPYGEYVLTVARLEPMQRVDLGIRALTTVPPPLRLVVVGDGSERESLRRLAEESGVADRVDFRGALCGDAVAHLYSGALAVVYPPFDEDDGYVTLDAFLSAKAVITASDSGGTLEFVEDGHNGFVCAPEPAAIAHAIARLAADRSLARRLGHAGRERARSITWDGVVERLLG
jgi:glycosyltransferase involved in cell wall biosynthesis